MNGHDIYNLLGNYDIPGGDFVWVYITYNGNAEFMKLMKNLEDEYGGRLDDIENGPDSYLFLEDLLKIADQLGAKLEHDFYDMEGKHALIFTDPSYPDQEWGAVFYIPVPYYQPYAASLKNVIDAYNNGSY